MWKFFNDLKERISGNLRHLPMMAATTGGYQSKSIVSLGSDNAQVLKNSPGSLGTCTAFNVNAAPRYLKFYDKATSPSPSIDVPVYVISMPGNTTGAGSNVIFDNLLFGNGISFALVTGIAVNDDTGVGAGDCVVSFGYR